MSEYIPKWHRELLIFNKIKPILILEGNVLDKYQYPTDNQFLPKGSITRNLPEYLHFYFLNEGYQNIAVYDNLEGFCNPVDQCCFERFAAALGLDAANGTIPATFIPSRNAAYAPEVVANALRQNQASTVVIMNFASRYITSPGSLKQEENDSFELLLKAAMDAREVNVEGYGRLKNLLVLLVNKINDLPAWFYLDNPSAKAILISTPTKEEREQFVRGINFKSFFNNKIYAEEYGYYEEHPEELDKIVNKFVAMTEGFSFTELNGLRVLCKNQMIHIKDMCSVIDLYKFGIQENPWNTLDYEIMRGAEAKFEERVKGQHVAITKTVDVIKRAMTGLSGLQHSSGTKPKGVLFFAGPTGTGKTETAKTLAERIFGDERSCIRFDMSEYSQAHSDQKLLGAPPGYVGYEAGGQLTNAIKNNPFSILLFDEIEKAHPSILDKFLQILEDGRMTDGQGNTVYFSETVIIFTSNLGVYQVDQNGQRKQVVTSNMSYAEVEQSVKAGINDYFKLQLGRPEILNRIGENIVVFDFIREEVALDILNAQLKKITRQILLDKNIEMEIAPAAYEVLTKNVLKNLDNGGRGIGNIVESLLINPLSRYLFDNNIFGNAKLTINTVNDAEMPYSLECTAETL